MSELLSCSAVELGKKIQRGEVSALEATQAALDRMAAGELNTYITALPEEALTRAEAVQKQIQSGEVRSPLAGVPSAIKDNICTDGVRTTCASRMLADFCPPYSAAVMERMEAAGTITLGKTNMDEFAMGSTTETSYFGPTKNPWDVTRVPGGSSGGAAAAVAGREAWFALASDTGGSIRTPASFCGVTGMKPTYGTVSRYGVVAYASSLDQVGPIARTAEDCAAILDVISGRDPRDGTSLDHPTGDYLQSLTGDIRGLKIGMPAEYFGEGLAEPVRRRLEETAETLKGLGAQVETFSMPLINYAIPAYYLISCAEAGSNLSRFDGVKYGFRAEEFDDLASLYKNTRSQGFGREVKKRILLGTFALSTGYYDAYYKKAQQVRGAISRAFTEAFTKYDLLLSPVSADTAPRLGEREKDPLQAYLSDVYTVSVNLAGLPALSMPCGFDEAGLPVGAQLIGPALEDKAVLNAAHAFQQHTAYHRQLAGEGGRG